MKKICRGALALTLAGLLLAGCSQKEDTRQYVDCIGIVITNEVGTVFDEMYIYPSTNQVNEKGSNLLPKRTGETWVGSYGATLAVSEAYNILVRDRSGGVYSFSGVALENGDEAVITYTEELYVTIHHRDGESVEMPGTVVEPGEAPARSYVEQRKKASFDFGVVNGLEEPLVRITMREAEDVEKGEVELYLDPLAPGKTAKVSGRIYEDDKEITAWVLHITTEGGESVVLDTPFDPWNTKIVSVLPGEEGYRLEVEPGDEASSSSSASSASAASPAPSAPSE